MTNNKIITIGIQKSERIKEDSLATLQKMGLSFDIKGRQLYGMDTTNQYKLFLLRSDEIVKNLDNGILDIGIYGKDTWLESEKPSLTMEYKNLDYSYCKLCLAVEKDSALNNLNDMEGKTIATSFRNILQRKLDKKKINATIVDMSGGVEAAIELVKADAIFDIVGTGASLEDNGLKAIQTLQKSNAIVVTKKGRDYSDYPVLQKLLKRNKETTVDIPPPPVIKYQIDVEARTYC